ncbi:colicin transporter [Trinickia fusca]|uniref:Colicin transporter n=1 Tax=Trinickia fusca TaxID=2419777 RepID=A0A494XP57_9BURK|nr:colicin transporter [Trinickia fusca]RKP52437.1 colicin transporter [Trinickia fusca]
MFRSPPTTLPISRFSVALRAAQVAAAVFALPCIALAQTAPAPDATSQPDTHAEAPLAASMPSNAFDARQKALDQRSAQNDYTYGVAVHQCYDTFFVNTCLGRARDKMRDVKAQIRSEQLSLDDERRAARAQQRDEQEALRRVQDESEAPQRAAADERNAQAYEEKQRQHALDAAKRNAEAPQRAQNQAAYDQKQADFQRKLDQAHAQAAQDAKERAERAQRFGQKQVDAAQHKADVEARQKQAAQKAQEKQQEQLQQQEQQKQLRQEQQDSE